jgi:hypothetical protein
VELHDTYDGTKKVVIEGHFKSHENVRIHAFELTPRISYLALRHDYASLPDEVTM